MNLIIRFLYNTSKVITIIFVIVITLLIIIQVINRNIIQIPIVWLDELAKFMFIWASFIGASVALKDKDLAAFDLLENKFGKTLNLIHKLIIEILVLFFLVVAFYYGLKLTFSPSVVGQESIAMRLPMPIVYFSFPLSMFLMIIYTLYNLVNLFRKGE